MSNISNLGSNITEIQDIAVETWTTNNAGLASDAIVGNIFWSSDLELFLLSAQGNVLNT